MGKIRGQDKICRSRQVQREVRRSGFEVPNTSKSPPAPVPTIQHSTLIIEHSHCVSPIPLSPLIARHFAISQGIFMNNDGYLFEVSPIGLL
jgi:hypothetical protein